MRPPRPDTRTKLQFESTGEFFDKEFGWVKRLPEKCPKCKRTTTMALLADQGFRGCTHCLFIQLKEGTEFLSGGYIEARKALETIFDERRVEKPIQPRFQGMNFKRN